MSSHDIEGICDAIRMPCETIEKEAVRVRNGRAGGVNVRLRETRVPPANTGEAWLVSESYAIAGAQELEAEVKS